MVTLFQKMLESDLWIKVSWDAESSFVLCLYVYVFLCECVRMCLCKFACVCVCARYAWCRYIWGLTAVSGVDVMQVG